MNATETETTAPMMLTLEEEVSIILNDIFDGDLDAQNAAIAELAEEHGIAVCPENETEIQELILDSEDALYARYLPVAEEVLNEE